ncbi:hypothetical protein Theco_0144 [Thermobacillus composti KWC4]|uniref:Uncharacterized protein n=1 Tax=Thermobacillus composti (strain DSM 18247 / JCM 13945 / KWC4) TaxID=717605 RepID=L0E9N1_THECK|nr:hypothetical protein [Thermobacillus composti]AGA56391.1 hypothetical protein Theco_0144 [Thermobacillus composti KWC4]
MWKMFSWLWKAAAAALLASFLAIWTTGYIVNSYVAALLEEYEIPLEKPPFALSGMWGRLWGVDAGAEEPQSGLTAAEAPDRGQTGGQPEADGAWSRSGGEGSAAEPAGEKQEPGAGGTGSGDGSSGLHEGTVGGPEGEEPPGGASGEQPGNEGEGGEASGATEESGFGTGPEAHGGAGASGGTVVSTEDLLEAKSRLTDDERNRLFAILVGKVPQEEWQRISEFTEGGLTAEELLQVQQIVAAYLDRSEYDELMGILNKF